MRSLKPCSCRVVAIDPSSELSEEEKQRIQGPYIEYCAMHKAAEEIFDAGSAIEDILEVPPMLGDHSQEVIGKAIERFREALKSARGQAEVK